MNKDLIQILYELVHAKYKNINSSCIKLFSLDCSLCTCNACPLSCHKPLLQSEDYYLNQILRVIV